MATALSENEIKLVVENKAANVRAQTVNEELSELRVKFNDASQKLKDSQADLGNERNEVSRLKTQVTDWFGGCAESAVSHNWQLEEKITLENIRKEEVYAHDHSIFTLVTSAADKQPDAVGNCFYRKRKQAT